jgi:hypothetical protein
VRRWTVIALVLVLGAACRRPPARDPDEDEDSEGDESVYSELDAGPPVRLPDPPPLPLPTNDVDAAWELAQHADGVGDYATAIGYLKAAYELNPSPIFLYDIGQIFYGEDDCYNAVAYYRRYLDVASAAAKMRPKVEQKIADLLQRCPDA